MNKYANIFCGIAPIGKYAAQSMNMLESVDKIGCASFVRQIALCARAVAPQKLRFLTLAGL